MKRSILGSTAIVAVGAVAATPAAAKIELGLSGFLNTYFSVASIDEGANDTRDFNPTGLFSDGEVHFSGEYTADNGIVFGAFVALEMFGDANTDGDSISERYAFVHSIFGEFYAGSANTAAYQMHYAAPFAGLPVNSGWVTVFIPANPDSSTAFEHPAVSTYIDFGGGDNSITYYTPRFAGFQLGVSYVPSVALNGDGKSFPVEADTETEYANGFSVGLNYVEDFNGFGVAVAGGYRYAQAPETLTSIGGDDYQAVSFGLNLSYAGFTIGGSYANEFDGMASCTTDSCATTTSFAVTSIGPGGSAFGTSAVTPAGLASTTEGYSWDAGISYEYGPWTFGVTYFEGHTEDLIADPDDDILRAVQGGFFYQMGPGITLGGGVMWADWQAESGDSNKGIAGALGLTFEF